MKTTWRSHGEGTSIIQGVDETSRRNQRYANAVRVLNRDRKRQEKLGLPKTKLSKIALSRIPGGWYSAFPILRKVARLDDASDASRLLVAWDELGGKENVTPEEIAEAAGMTMGHMIGVIAEAAYDNSVAVSRLIEALNLEEIMDRAVKEAKKPDGFKDREKILQSAGLYPTPSGATFINQNNSVTSASLRSGPVSATDGLESMEDDTIEFTTLVRGGAERKIESPSKLIETIPEQPASASDDSSN